MACCQKQRMKIYFFTLFSATLRVAGNMGHERLKQYIKESRLSAKAWTMLFTRRFHSRGLASGCSKVRDFLDFCSVPGEDEPFRRRLFPVRSALWPGFLPRLSWSRLALVHCWEDALARLMTFLSFSMGGRVTACFFGQVISLFVILELAG